MISDNQYAVLGLMLMGTLAKTQSVTKRWRKEFGGCQDEKLELGMEDETSEEKESGAREIDLGEVVRRDGVKGTRMAKNEGGGEVGEGHRGKKKRGSVREQEGGKASESVATPAQRPKKKRKKGGDAFDDIFAGLI